MAEVITLARPYARAAFDHAQSAQVLTEWSDVLSIAGLVVADQSVRQLMTNPRMAEKQKAEFILECTEKSVDEEFRNFILLLADSHRLVLLPEIAKLFETFRADLERTIQVSVSSPFELTAEQQQKLALALSTKLERTVHLETTLDKSLIGGVVIRTGDLVIDASVRGKLTKLAESLGS